MADLRDKVVIVTGSSSGIGAETAVKFAECGAKVVITGRNQSGIDETVDRCKQAGANHQQLLSMSGDLTDRDFIAKLVQDTVSTFGDIHVLVNNAANIVWKYFETTTADDVVSQYNNNLVTAFNLTQQAMPHLIKTKGCIVNVSSISGTRVTPEIFAYSLAKAAMDHMTKILAVELAPKGVRVNSVNPGDTATPIFTRPDNPVVKPNEADKVVTHKYSQSYLAALKGFASYSHLFNSMARYYPLGRIGQPCDVASAILFLASEQSSFMTGVLMHVDGGLHQTIRGEVN